MASQWRDSAQAWLERARRRSRQGSGASFAARKVQRCLQRGKLSPEQIGTSLEELKVLLGNEKN